MLIQGKIKCGECGVKLERRFWKHGMSFDFLCKKCYDKSEPISFHIKKITEYFPAKKADDMSGCIRQLSAIPGSKRIL